MNRWSTDTETTPEMVRERLRSLGGRRRRMLSRLVDRGEERDEAEQPSRTLTLETLRALLAA
jgi:hypothetical protein